MFGSERSGSVFSDGPSLVLRGQGQCSQTASEQRMSRHGGMDHPRASTGGGRSTALYYDREVGY